MYGVLTMLHRLGKKKQSGLLRSTVLLRIQKNALFVNSTILNQNHCLLTSAYHCLLTSASLPGHTCIVCASSSADQHRISKIVFESASSSADQQNKQNILVAHCLCCEVSEGVLFWNRYNDAVSLLSSFRTEFSSSLGAKF